uniref:Uncharacterized protein n=1 Tax=Magallana gigas TaxID=29159 RepID=K1Q6X4_MAGGI
MPVLPDSNDCILTSMEVGDGLDNDCDGKVDEEICGDFTESTHNILDTTDSTTETAITAGFMRTKRSTTTQFSNTVNIPRTSGVSTMATTKISDIHERAHIRSKTSGLKNG